MRTIVDNVPPPFVFLFIALIFIGASWFIFFLKKKSIQDTKPPSGLLAGILSGFYSIFLGFIIYLLWSDYQDARLVVVDETTKLYVISESSKDFPPQVSKQIKEDLINYISIVTHEEWHAMRTGDESFKAHKAIDKIYDTLLKYRPDNSVSLLFYDKALTSLNAAIEDRSHRINMLNVAIPVAWYFVIFFGAFALLVMSIFLLKDTFINVIMHLLFCIFLAFYVTAVIVLSFPFSGMISVSNEPLKKLLVHINSE
ncbi:DUF4239 domain-containing protein [Legionella brunensis]|uniref:DUF4239 domain-containing protein n=1 Tax=Legionella brunensis TaxID=29422 RepID=A0A0W0STZ5_9GAMM|nr:DUF4239 domain-containing protein [Legionella brunensis]KTC86732.1 hypothetical protein Lbru_0673 [Legionella brunensis]